MPKWYHFHTVFLLQTLYIKIPILATLEACLNLTSSLTPWAPALLSPSCQQCIPYSLTTRLSFLLAINVSLAPWPPALLSFFLPAKSNLTEHTFIRPLIIHNCTQPHAFSCRAKYSATRICIYIYSFVSWRVCFYIYLCITYIMYI